MKQRVPRRYDIDWLRLLAVLFLFTFHTARVFDTSENFYVQNAELSKGLTYLFVHAFNPWHMQLFFLLSGASSYYALQFRSGKQYAKERFTRLLIPLIFGLFVVIPPQVYFAERHHNGFSGSFLAFYPSFFNINFEDLSGYTGGWTPAHLWFILFLFVLSLVALPLFLHLNGENGKKRLASFAEALQKPGMIFLLGIPLGLSLLLPDLGGKNPFYYLLFLILGFIFVAEPRFEEIIDRQKAAALVIAVISVGSSLAYGLVDIELSQTTVMLLYGLVYSFGTLACLITLLGYARKLLSFGNPVLKYLNPAAYPIYILHQTVIVAVSFYVVQWSLPVWIKFALIVALSFLATLGIYDILIKRFNIIRFVFGLKPIKK